MDSLKILVLVTFLSVAGIANTQDNKELSGIKWNVGFGVLRNGYEGGFGLVSPKVLKFGTNDHAQLATFLDFGFLTLPDSSTSAGRLQDAQNLQGALGLRITTTLSESIMDYVKLGANFINWDSKLMNSDGSASSWGALIVFGSDFLLNSLEIENSAVKNRSAYVEAEWKIGHKRTDSVVGQPGLFNGIGINCGYRVHY